MESDLIIQARILAVLPHLDELKSRIYLAAEAQSLGRGGVSKIAKLSNTSRQRIVKGKQDLQAPGIGKRVRKTGAGRKKLIDRQPEIMDKIKSLVEPHTIGNPMNALIWTSKSVRKISSELLGFNLKVCHEVVRKCLKSLGFSLQANKKTDEGSKNEDRNEQFEHINNEAISFMEKNCPVISVDCKKKELIGNFKNNGQEWQPKKEPLEVKVYDFIDKELGKAVPYGIYDIAQNEGFVNVGISADTAEFAVNAIRTWWQKMGKERYPNATELYLNADGGGSNSSRGRLWKTELQKFATETGLTISVSHFPSGTSKWNKTVRRCDRTPFIFLHLNQLERQAFNKH